MTFIGKDDEKDSGGLSLKPSKSMEDIKWDIWRMSCNGATNGCRFKRIK